MIGINYYNCPHLLPLLNISPLLKTRKVFPNQGHSASLSHACKYGFISTFHVVLNYKVSLATWPSEQWRGHQHWFSLLTQGAKWHFCYVVALNVDSRARLLWVFDTLSLSCQLRCLRDLTQYVRNTVVQILRSLSPILGWARSLFFHWTNGHGTEEFLLLTLSTLEPFLFSTPTLPTLALRSSHKSLGTAKCLTVSTYWAPTSMQKFEGSTQGFVSSYFSNLLQDYEELSF